jgi:hypothetical protein
LIQSTLLQGTTVIKTETISTNISQLNQRWLDCIREHKMETFADFEDHCNQSDVTGIDFTNEQLISAIKR